LNNEIKIFGLFLNEFEDSLTTATAHMNLRFNVNNLKSKKAVLNWYIDMNSGGTPHTEEEIERVKKLMDKL